MQNKISDNMLKRLESTLVNIDSIKDQILEVSNAISNKLQEEGRIIFVGAGMAPEMVKIIFDELWFNFQITGGKFASLTAARNYVQDTDKWKELEEIYSASIFELDEIGINKNDLLIGISASGQTQYVLSAIKYAHDLGCTTAAVTDFSDTKIYDYADYVINTGFGKPPILGLNTGIGATLQKIVIDLLIYNSMAISGRIYKDHLVFMKPVSSKIYNYCIQTIEALLDIDQDKARDLFEDSNKQLEIALIRGKHNCSIEEANQILIDNNNNFNKIFA